MKKILRKNYILSIALSFGLMAAPSAALGAEIHSERVIGQAIPKVNSLRIQEVDGVNALLAIHSKVPKQYKVRYAWTRAGKAIAGESNSYYYKSVSDCGSPIRVVLTVFSGARKVHTKTSSAYNPSICTWNADYVSAGQALSSCNSKPVVILCQLQGEEFHGLITNGEHGTPWFRVGLGGVPPERLISWRARVDGAIYGVGMRVTMISSDSPNWTCCDFTNAVFPARGTAGWWSAPYKKVSPEGYAYIGLDYFDVFELTETIRVRGLFLEIQYR